MEIFALLAYIINYGLNIFFESKKQKIGSFITKALLTPPLLLIYLAGDKEPKISVAFALLFCLLGDIFLEFTNRFLQGLVAFWVGHIFYGISFLSDIGKVSRLPWWLLLLAVIYVTYGIVLRTRLTVTDLKIKIAITIYSVTISLVSLLSILRAGNVTAYSFFMVLAGTLVFIASDSILAYNRFRKRSKNGTVWVMVTYGAAQLMIIMGI